MLKKVLIILFSFICTMAFATTTGSLAKQKYYRIVSKSTNLDHNVLYLGLLAYENARIRGLDGKGLLTIVDFTRASNKKRLWVFDIENEKLLYNTYVTHGAGSGFLYANRFSNKEGTHESSIGLFDTRATYTGSVGYSLRLEGLERRYNDHAMSRAIVMHGANYANPNYIDKYGRLGRSWGCFAMPENIYREIIDNVKGGSLIFAYYPNEEWLAHSEYLQDKEI